MVKFYEYEMQDEKKTEDVDDSPLDSRKRDASIESPASETSPAFSIQKGKLFVDGKKLKKSSISPPLSPDENLESNTPLSELRRNVSFNGIGDSPPSNIPGATREESLERELQKMREKMTQVQIDYQAEKATRKRKEKNLVKLAKELNKRTAEIDVKDLHIKRVSTLHFFIRSCVLACIRGNYYHCEFSRKLFLTNRVRFAYAPSAG
jgi:vesicle coat complex subunit